MFYNLQPQDQQEQYKTMLSLVGSLSNLFSTSQAPMLYYRAHENIFCKYFDAKNLSREDCSIDATKGSVGIGLKTWVGSNHQKVAEFNKLHPIFGDLTGKQLVTKVSEYRNERIRVTKKLHGLDSLVYHVIKRTPQAMQIYEHEFNMIDTESIVMDASRSSLNNLYFSDGNHRYSFNVSKSTLYMDFADLKAMDTIDVDILSNPFDSLAELHSIPSIIDAKTSSNSEQLRLRLYSVDKKGRKYVPLRSGINQWNANGRDRHPDELYIPYPAQERSKSPLFFPQRGTPFGLVLPNGKEVEVQVCQRAYKKVSKVEYSMLSTQQKAIEDKKSRVGKAVMSRPNNMLGNWLLRDVLGVPEGEIVTYDILREFGADSVVFTKKSKDRYSIDFCR